MNGWCTSVRCVVGRIYYCDSLSRQLDKAECQGLRMGMLKIANLDTFEPVLYVCACVLCVV